MMDGTLETIDGRDALRFERTLPHAPERVWRAVSDPAEMEAWFVAPVPWTPELGETFEAAGQPGRITELEPGRLIAWEWAEERYSFEVSPDPDGNGSRLVFLHFFDASFGPGAQHAAGWEAYFSRLDATLDGHDLSEADAHAIVPELSERYAVAMDADPAPARESYAKHGPLQVELEDGPRLRFERRYGYSQERVWHAINDPTERAEWFPSDVDSETIESVPESLLILSFWDTRLRFELEADGDGCRLVFTHEFDDPDDAAKTAAGWDRCFTRMDAHLAGTRLGEKESVGLWPIVHERYAEAFGIDPEIGRRAMAEHPLTD